MRCSQSESDLVMLAFVIVDSTQVAESAFVAQSCMSSILEQQWLKLTLVHLKGCSSSHRPSQVGSMQFINFGLILLVQIESLIPCFWS